MKTGKFVELVRAHGIDPKLILDLGCFDGQQAIELTKAFPEAEVIAFEADLANAGSATGNCMGFPKISVIHAAVGDKDGVVTFYRAIGANRECGSLLVPNGKYFELMPTKESRVTQLRLDSLLGASPEIIWMDVQGNELAALNGMGRFLDGVKMIWTEVCFNPYYHGQMLAADFDREMAQKGFSKIAEFDGIPGWFGDVCYHKAQ
jgi:FkbM family methyltransferase